MKLRDDPKPATRGELYVEKQRVRDIEMRLRKIEKHLGIYECRLCGGNGERGDREGESNG